MTISSFRDVSHSLDSVLACYYDIRVGPHGDPSLDRIHVHVYACTRERAEAKERQKRGYIWEPVAVADKLNEEAH